MLISRVGKKFWQDMSQPGELRFHQTCASRADGSFRNESDSFLISNGFTKDCLAGKTVLDAGCGSVLRTKFFEDIYLIGIDPLALEFSNLKWSDVFTANKVYPQALETYIPELERLVDYTFSVNVLDHCFDFELCINNLVSYSAPKGKMFLSYDEHFSTDTMHPLVLTMDGSLNTFLKFNLKILKVSSGEPFGNGDRSLNFWLGVD